jgi:RimJ/RimL family protein N-acetyltransferase
MPDPLDDFQTPRLVLRPLIRTDADEVLRIYGDAETWQHLPQGRFTSLVDAHRHIDDALESHRLHGLGPWAVRLRPEGESGSALETVIGTGGIRHLGEPGVWNLGYRLDPRAWGQGYATELARAAMDAVAKVSPAVPVTARALVSNPASLAVLDKVGLSTVWEGVRTGGDPADGTPLVSRVYADRPLAPHAMEWLVRNA